MPKSVDKKNTFKFQTFEELIKVDILIKKRTKLDDNEESHLVQCFSKWTTLNCSLEFIELRNKIGPKILTLNLLLINKEKVVNILFESIEKCTSISCIAVMDLLQHLVCDIRQDFLPYLERSFYLITSVIERAENDAEMLLSAFSCIAHVLLFLERSLINDIQQLLTLIKPLLFHKRKYYIRHFAAQSLAYLLRKSKDFKTVLSKNILIDLLEGNTGAIYSDAIGHLMSSCIKTNESIYSSGPKLFINYFEILHERQDEFFINCFDEMFKCLLNNLSVVGYSNLWKLIIDQISVVNDQKTPDELSLLVMELFFKHANTKSLLTCVKPIVSHVKTLIRENSSNKLVEIAKLIVDKLPFSRDIHDILRALISCKGMNIDGKFELVAKYINNQDLEMILKNWLNDYLSTFINESWLESNPNNFYIIIKEMTKLLLKKYPISNQSQWNKNIGQINFNLFFIEDETESLQKRIIKVINGEYIGEDYEEILWMVCMVIPHLYPINADKTIMECLKNNLEPLLKSEINTDVLVKINALFECIVQLESSQKSSIQIPIDLNQFINIIDQHEYDSPLEPVLLEIVYKSFEVEQKPEAFAYHVPLFIRKLQSPSHQTRLNSILILKRILRNDSTVENYLNICEEIENLYELHETELVKKERSVINFMNKIVYRKGMSRISKEIIVSYLMGTLHIQVSSLWKSIGQILSSFYVTDQSNEFSSKEEQQENESIIWSVTENQLNYCQKMIASNLETENQITFYCDLHNQFIMDKFYRSRTANWLQLRMNIIKFLTRIPDFSGKKTITLSPLILSIYTDEFTTNKSPKKIREDTLIAMMVLYSKFPNISCTKNEKLLKNLYYKCLTSKKPALQLAAFEVLINYKIPEIQQYKLQIIEYLKNNKDELKQLSLSLIQPGHRQVMVPIMLRIVVGKLKSIGKTKKKNHIISYLLELDQSELGHLLTILVEGLKVTDDKYELVKPEEDIQMVSDKIRQSVCSGELPIFVVQAIFKTLQGVCMTLKLIIENLLNKLSNDHLNMLLRVILDFYACCHYQREAQQETSIINMKVLRQTLTNIVLFYFNKIETFDWSEMLLDEITKLMIDPNVEKLVEQNQTSANITIQLCLLWSEKKQFVTRITPQLIQCFVELLLKSKLKREIVGYKLVTILYNIMQHANTGLEYGLQFQASIISHLPAIIEYLSQRIKNIKLKNVLKLSLEMSTTRQELEMVTISVDYIMKSKRTDIDKDTISAMINCMLVFLYNTNKTSLVGSEPTDITEDNRSEIKEQMEVDFLRAIESLSNIVDADHNMTYFERFLGLFSRLRKRASRMVLSIFISKLWPILSVRFQVSEEFKNLGEISIKLNSWNEKELGEMDCELIYDTIDEVNNIVKTLPIKDSIKTLSEAYKTKIHPNLWVYYLVSQNCLFILSEVSELKNRMIAQDFLENLIRSIAECNDEKIIQSLFYENIWPALKHGISNKRELFHKSFIGIMKTVVQALGKTNRFKEIAHLAESQPGESNSFFDNMLSMTPALISKGLRQLIKFLGKNSVSTLNVIEILLPLIWKRLELISEEYNTKDRSTLTNAHRESLVSSFEALTAIAKHLPIEQYEKLINEQLNKLKNNSNIELGIKIIIAILNGYNSEKYDEKDDHSFMMKVLNELEKHLSKRLPKQNRHKHAQKSTDSLKSGENSEWAVQGVTLQVPIVLAIVNVVIRLPKKYLKETITKVIFKICDFLKAEETEVRKEAGNTLFNILEILNSPELNPQGPIKYLGFFIQTIKNSLNRGFQRHVGLYTCHSVLSRLHEKRYFDRLTVDELTIKTMGSLYIDELFGEMAKEKAERASAEKGIVHEAREIRAFEGFRLLGNILEKKHIMNFFQIIISASQGYRSDTNLRKVQTIFDSIQSKGGLLKNRNLEATTVFEIAFMLITENSESLFKVEKDSKINREIIESGPIDLHLYRPTRRFDEEEAPKMSSLRSGSHLIVNHGLSLLHQLCKLHNSSTEIELTAMLDPVLNHILNILDTVQYQAIMLSGLKCLYEIVRVDPPSLSENFDRIRELLFSIHRKYSTYTDIKDVDKEQITKIFHKTITLFIQKPGIQLNNNEYKVLLLGVMVNSQNKEREMKSFDLLKALIENRIRQPAKSENIIVLSDESFISTLNEIMINVRNIALVSPRERERKEARSAIASYLKNYKQSTKFINEYIYFLFVQMSECLQEDGQLSGCLIMKDILKLYTSTELNMENFSPSVIAGINVTMATGVTDKVRKLLDSLTIDVMQLVNSDTHVSLCNLVFECIYKFKPDDRNLLVAFHMMAIMLKTMQGEYRTSQAKRFLDICLKRIPELLENSCELDEQFKAAKGTDSELMAELSNCAKKQKTDDKSIKTTNEDDLKLESSEELSIKLTNVIENIKGILLGLSSLLDANVEDQNEVGIMRETIELGLSTNVWNIIIEKILRTPHSALRLNATKNIIYQLLSIEHQYKSVGDIPFGSEEMINSIIRALFHQYQNLQITLDECNGVLVNLVLLWQIILQNFSGEMKYEFCKKIIYKANFAANNELLNGKSIVIRCAILKFIASVSTKTKWEDLEKFNFHRKILQIWLREERQTLDKNNINNKKSSKRKSSKMLRFCTAQEIIDWKDLVTQVGECIKKSFGEEKQMKLIAFIEKDRKIEKQKRKIEESNLAVSNPGEALRKKIKKSKRNF